MAFFIGLNAANLDVKYIPFSKNMPRRISLIYAYKRQCKGELQFVTPLYEIGYEEPLYSSASLEQLLWLPPAYLSRKCGYLVFTGKKNEIEHCKFFSRLSRFHRIHPDEWTLLSCFIRRANLDQNARMTTVNFPLVERFSRWWQNWVRLWGSLRRNFENQLITSDHPHFGFET